MAVLEKIISGGQTGADRAALDCAMEHGIPHGGWCPKGRLAEDGLIELRYKLEETPSSEYAQRTEWNVRDSQGTVVFSIAAKLSGGSQRTVAAAKKHRRPCLHLSRRVPADMAREALLRFIRQNKIRCLNVAGPRASEEPEAYRFVKQALSSAFRALGKRRS